MAVFQYRAVGGDGAVAEGRVDAGSRQEACRQLEAKGLKPINVEETQSNGKHAGGLRLGLSRRSNKVPQRSLDNFTRQLSSLLASGVPLSRAMSILCKEAAVPAAQAQWQKINDLVIDGTSLADAMAQSPETFPKVYTAMVQAGETGGFLDLVLGQIADFQDREKELRAKVMSALAYPIVLGVLAVVVVIFLMIFFIPKFEDMFNDMGVQLPLITEAVIAFSHLVYSKYGLITGTAVVVALYYTRDWLKSENGQRAWERMVLKLPLIGSLAARFAMARFCRMLGTLAKSGVPLIASLRVASETIGNQTLTDTISSSIERVKQGDALAASLADCPELFPGSVLEIISISEETGMLDKELIRLASVTEEELDRQLKMTVSLAEPFMLLVMAVVVGIIIIAMVLPIFSIGDHIK